MTRCRRSARNTDEKRPAGPKPNRPTTPLERWMLARRRVSFPWHLKETPRLVETAEVAYGDRASRAERAPPPRSGDSPCQKRSASPMETPQSAAPSVSPRVTDPVSFSALTSRSSAPTRSSTGSSCPRARASSPRETRTRTGVAARRRRLRRSTRTSCGGHAGHLPRASGGLSPRRAGAADREPTSDGFRRAGDGDGRDPGVRPLRRRPSRDGLGVRRPGTIG